MHWYTVDSFKVEILHFSTAVGMGMEHHLDCVKTLLTSFLHPQMALL